MRADQRARWVFVLLLAAWLLVVAWQIEEHHRVVSDAKTDLRIRAHEIDNTLSAVTQAMRFRGGVLEDHLSQVLKELVNNRTNALVKLISVGLLNADGDLVMAEGDTNLLSHEKLAENELWSESYVTFVLPIEDARVSPEGVTNNPTFVLPAPPFRGFTNGEPRDRDFSRHEPRFESTNGFATGSTNPPDPGTNAGASTVNMPPPDNFAGGLPPPPPGEERHPPGGDRPRGGNHRLPWMRGMSDADFKAYIAKHELHGLFLVMDTDSYRAVCIRDGWLRLVVGFFAGISALGIGLAWRNLAKTTELQIRLVRASELNSHLKEMNLAAAGLAHETRNPLNIIRGQAQMISRQAETPPEVRDKSRVIVAETDKVTAQLTEFINYSRPREVRRTKIALTAAASEVVHTLGYDLEEKKARVEVSGDPLAIEADEQLLRQVLFNLLLNAIQASSGNGRIQVVVQRAGAAEAVLEIRDDGPGVPPENRSEIFKPYFTTHQKGTGLGLAVVQQNVLAHGWEIVCLGNEPQGAIFRITHLKIAV
jgi:signal transduction histidine kinase